MALTAPPPAPLASDTPAVFDAKTYALMQWYATNVAELNLFQISNNALVAASELAAKTSAAQAVVAKDQALAAWAASMSPAETLPAISKSIHSGAVVKGIIYDTSKDTDGGAWRKRCADKSWYQEALGFTGTWRSQLANAAAAWAVSGAAAGGGYQNTTDGKYYVLSGTNSQTEIFRGNVREFPEAVAIIAEASRVVIYDLTQPGCPMWMVIPAPLLSYGTTVTSLEARCGSIHIGASNGLFHFNFIPDFIDFRQSGNYRGQPLISSRGAAGLVVKSGGSLVNNTVNDVAITVLDGAPIDPATGLPVPTIWVGTGGGLSVIQHNGVVVNEVTRSQVKSISVISPNRIFAGTAAANWRYTYYTLTNGAITVGGEDGKYAQTGLPNLNLGNVVGSVAASTRQTSFATTNSEGAWMGLGLRIENPTSPLKSIGAAITNTYNTGWMPGDIRGAYLADTTAETITGSGELVTNGTFTTDTSGWTLLNSTFVASTGVARLTNSGAAIGYAYQNISTVVGKTYYVNATFVAGTATPRIQASANISSTGSDLGVSTTGVLVFVATSTTTILILTSNSGASGFYSDFDNISVKLADPDRSVKNNGLIINGTLTKTAVASGAGLVAYSGFSAANYLEQPYNANLDFGTGDFSVMGWVNSNAHSGSQTLMFRSSVPYATNYIQLGKASDGTVYLATKGATTERTTATSGSPITVGAPCFVVATRTSGVLSMWINGVMTSTVSFAAEDVTSTGAITRLGVSTATTPGNIFNGSLALWRISATAPSADQIAHIYRTELPLFQAGAACTIAGISSAVTAMAYDETADLLQVGTSWGRSGFKDLLRIDSEATTTGAITSLSANQGAILTGGTSGRYYQPAMLLRDELRRRDEVRKALGKVPVFFDFDTASFTSPTTSGSAALTASSIVGTPYIGMGITGTGIPAGTTLIGINGPAYTMSANATITNAGAVAIAQSSFTLQQGYTAKAVYSAEALKREGATKTYTRANDGFRETINFAVSPGSAVWVSIMAIRSN